MLEPATPNTIPDQVQPPPPPIFVDSEPEFEIAKNLDLNLKINYWCHKCKFLYLVCWTGYAGTNEETLWILMTELGNTPELVSDYHKVYLAKLGPLNQV